MRLPLYQVDAFVTAGVFTGNPAAVCPLDEWLDDRTMQAIAAENNLAETAFVTRRGPEWAIRWMTPVLEVDLCGHATLAAGHVVLEALDRGRDEARFQSRSGLLRVVRSGDRLALDFPAARPQAATPEPELEAALGATPLELFDTPRDHFAVLRKAEDVRNLSPNVYLLSRLRKPVCVTAPGGDGADFVVRFFAPTYGIPEDPVTGSVHCTLIPYWADRLGRATLLSRQLSPRGGELACELHGDRVTIAGRTAAYLEGTIEIPG